MPRPRKNVEAAQEEAPIHDPERERDELIAEAASDTEEEPKEQSLGASGDEAPAQEAEATSPEEAPEYEEPFVTVRIKPELRAAKVRVRDGSGKEWVIADGEMRSVPESALKSNPKYLIQA